MLIKDCISKMTKLYLKRITDSIVKEQISRNADENRLREHIRQNIDSLSDNNRIANYLSLDSIGQRDKRILMYAILWNLLEQPNSKCEEDKLYTIINDYEKDIINKSQEMDLSKIINERDLDIYGTILEVALEDNKVTKDEFSLLKKLRDKLKITRLHSRIIEGQLGKYPKPNNKLHSRREYSDMLISLQKKGVVFYCNDYKGKNIVVIPDEIRNGVKKLLGFELRSECHKLLHDEISRKHLKVIARNFELNVSGRKDEISDRIIKAGCKPSEELNILSREDLYNICNNLKGVAVSGSKSQKIKNIIEYYDNLNIIPPEDTEDPRSKYYQYLENLASRNNQELYRIKLIKKDKEMESYFEEGTRYLFEKKLGFDLLKFDGSDNPDGGVEFHDGELLYWDNKSKESEYTFPQSHYNQFRKYINNSNKRVKVFLVIVPEIAEEAEIQAIKLKQNTKTDTDIALITAGDLKYISENWRVNNKHQEFNLGIFNMTGILNRKKIEMRSAL